MNENEVRLVRAYQIIGDKRRGIPPMLPVTSSTLYRWLAADKFPKPYIRRGKFTAWRLSDVLAWIEKTSREEASV